MSERIRFMSKHFFALFAICFMLAVISVPKAHACCFELTISCEDNTCAGDPLLYTGTITNCESSSTITVWISDLYEFWNGNILYEIQDIPVGATVNFAFTLPAPGPSPLYIWGKQKETGGLSVSTFNDECVVQECGGAGCTPGYWRNHLEDWPATGFSPSDDFDTVFGVDFFDPNITLEEAANAKGGGVKKVARHGTAAILSAAHPSVGYSYTIAEVIAIVQSGNVGGLVDANELGSEGFCD